MSQTSSKPIPGAVSLGETRTPPRGRRLHREFPSAQVSGNGKKLPARPGPALDWVGLTPNTPTNSPTKARVLIVHRMPLARLAVAKLVNDSPRLAVCAETDGATDACELFRRHQPRLVVLGLTLRGGDGIGLLKDLRKCDPAAGCVVLTTREDALSVQRAFRAGACGYLSIQDPATEVAQTLEHALDGKLHASDRVCHALLEDLAHGPIRPVGNELRRLSDRELQVLSLIGRGFGASRLALELHLSVKTIETHQMRIKQKLGLRTAAELSEKASRWMVELARRNLSLRRQSCEPRMATA